MGDKKKKKKSGKKAEGSVDKRTAAKPAEVVRKVKALAENPLVVEVVSAALIATAAALRDPKKARQLAEGTGDELRKLGTEGAEKGSALWTLALDIGRRALDTLGEEPPKKKRKSAAKKG